MKTLNEKFFVAIMLLLSNTGFAFSQEIAKIADETQHQLEAKDVINTNGNLKTYVIEREIPEAGNLTSDQLKGVSQTSCSVLKELGPEIKWLHSYVTANKIYCVYQATSEDILKEHAKRGGFPANFISQVSTVISPVTAE